MLASTESGLMVQTPLPRFVLGKELRGLVFVVEVRLSHLPLTLKMMSIH